MRDHDIIPHTQDMDLVVDQRYWPLFSRALLNPDSLTAYINTHPEIAELVGENDFEESDKESQQLGNLI